jgi:hypothetical protein
MLRKLLIFKCVLLLTFFSLTSQAALQWDVAAFISTGTAIVVTGLAMVSAAPIIITGALAVGFHAAVIGLYWNDVSPPLSGSGQAGVKSISVVIDLNTPLITPDTWTQGAIGAEPVPPQNASVSIKATPLNHYVGQISGINKADFESKAKAALEAESPGYLFIVTYNTDTFQVEIQSKDKRFPASSYDYEMPYTDVDETGCQAGYTLASGGATCNLTDVTKVKKPSDGSCEFRRANGVFTKSAIDPDCDAVTVTGSGTTTLSAVTAGRSVYLATAADDKVSVYTKEYNAQSGQTITTVANLSSAQIVSLISQTVAAGDTTAVAPVAGGGSGSGTGTTEGAALDSSLQVKAGGDEVLGDNASPTQGVAAPAMFGSTFDPLKAWTIPLNAGACPVGSFSVFNKTYNFDAQCALFAQYLPEIKASMGVFYTFTALIIVLGA